MFDTVECKDNCSEASEINCYNCETRDVFLNGVEAQKKHTLQQVIEWGNTYCLNGGKHGRPTNYANVKKWECRKCWAELAKGVEGG